mgnify:CR=1 FL=1
MQSSIKNYFIIVGCDQFRFLVLGDWGGLPVSPYRTFIEKSVALSLETIASMYDTQFQVTLGDNFYYDGVADIDDHRFKVRATENV